MQYQAMLNNLMIKSELWFVLFGAIAFDLSLGMGHYGRLWRPPNRAEMNKKILHFAIVPDVIEKKQNLTFIHVRFRQTVDVVLGTKVALEAIGDPPSNITWPADNNTLHTLLLVDPDFPIKKPATHGEFFHWMVGNIPGANVDAGETIMEYMGYRAALIDPNPHRYVFLVYKQPSLTPIKFDEPRFDDKQIFEREVYNSTAKAFAGKYNLTNTAINFFLVYHKEIYEHDDLLVECVAARQTGEIISPFLSVPPPDIK